MDLSIMTILSLLAASIIIGMLSSMLGIGGGSLFVPLLTLGLGLGGQTAVGTNLLYILFTAISSTIAYIKEKLIDYKVALLLSIGTVPGGILGAYITKYFSSSTLVTIFAVFLLIFAVKIFTVETGKGSQYARANKLGYERKLIDARGRRWDYHVNLYPGVLASGGAGFISGLLGIGGGVVMVPTMNLVAGIPMHLSISASMLIICLTSLSGVAVHWALGHVLFNYAVILAFGTIVGAQMGARLASRLRSSILRRLFALVLILISARMLLLGIMNY